MKQGTVSSDIVRILLNYASSVRISTDEICRRNNLDIKALLNADKRISVSEYLLIWKEVQKETKDPYFGLHYGEATRDLFRGNILCTMMMNCKTVGEAISKFIRYYCLMSDLVLPKVKLHNDMAYFTFQSKNEMFNLDRHISDSFIIMLFAVLHCLTSNNVEIADIQFKYASPENLNEYIRIFNSPVSFSKDEYAVIFKREILSQPVFLANPVLFNSFEQIAEKLLERLISTKYWTNKVIEIISGKLINGECPNMKHIAENLAISIRNLQYRLKEEGTTYQILLNQVRKDIALCYINKSDITLYDIAFILGFSEQSSFNHAFKKWTGVKPTEYLKSIS